MDWLNKAKKVAGGAASQVQTKVDHTKTRRRADDAAKQLGYLIFRERTGGAPAGEEADRLIAEIKSAEGHLAAEPSAEAEPASGDTEAEPPPAEV
jgi:hypothetical protein